MSKRILVNKKNVSIIDGRIKVISDEINHIKALRYRVHDKVNINEYVVEITKIDKDTLLGNVLGLAEKKGEPKVNITLIQSYLKSDKMDYVVQKAVELGITNFLPVISKNTVVKLDEKDRLKKKERIEKISKEAVMQCGRTDSINILNIEDLEQVNFSVFSHVILCYEEGKKSLKDEVKSIIDKFNINDKIAVIIGPEGGFEKTEVERLSALKNVTPVVFGERILRAETASVYILSILDYELDN